MQKSDPPFVLNHFPSKKIVKHMGLSGDQDGIMHRYINEEGNWYSHLKNTKDYITDFLKKKSAKAVSIYGSGWLLDVPIDYMLENCNKIFLYDIRHPKPLLNRYKKHPKIEFITADITGGYIEYMYRNVKKKNLSALNELPEATIPLTKESDYICSVNLLNQLDVLIVEYLNTHNIFSKEAVCQLRKKIQTNHLLSLPKEHSVIITDFEEILFDRTNQFIKKQPLIYTDMPQGQNTKQWEWKFDTKMAYYPNRITHFNVLATEL